MKTKFLFIVILFCCSLPLFAQTNPLVGTWKVVSIKGTDADGKPISADGSQFVETKIITPTHYSLITQMKQGDSLVFAKAIAGRVQVEGNKYIEIPLYSSQGTTSKAEFTYRKEGDKFIQSGVATHPNGQKNAFEIVFQKAKETASSNPMVGTWNQISSSGVNANGEKWSHTNATHIRFLTVSPSHYMIVRMKDNKFEDALGGTYSLQGNKFIPKFEMYSLKRDESRQYDLTQEVKGNKLYMKGILTDKEGKHTWEDVYERVDSRTGKTASK